MKVKRKKANLAEVRLQRKIRAHPQFKATLAWVLSDTIVGDPYSEYKEKQRDAAIRKAAYRETSEQP